MENQPHTREEPLYKRLGGYDAIAAVTDEFYSKLSADDRLARFFVGIGDESNRRLRQLTVEMICRAAGGPCSYTGRSMGDSHRDLGITEEDWEYSLGYLEETLDLFNIGGKEREDILSLITSYREEIIRPSKEWNTLH